MYRVINYLPNNTEVLAQACNPSTQEVEAGGLQFWDQPGLYSQKKGWKGFTNIWFLGIMDAFYVQFYAFLYLANFT